MKKIAAVITCAGMITTMLAGCGGTVETAVSATNSVAVSAEVSETTITGQVTAIDANSVTLALGELSSQEAAQQPPQTSGTADSSATEATASESGSASSSSTGQPPAMPSGDTASGSSGQPPEMPSGDGTTSGFTLTGEEKTVVIPDSAVITIESDTSTGSVSDIAVGDILTVTLSGDTVTAVTVSDTSSSGGASGSAGFSVDAGSSVETTGVLTVDGEAQTKDDLSLTSSTSNESTIKVTNGGSLTSSNSTLNKTGGEMTVEEASDFFGANAGVLADSGSTLTLSDSTINTTVSGGNGVFSTGEGTEVNVSNVDITTTGDHSRGLDATYTGTINADNVTINTAGTHCAAAATDRGEGTVNVTNSVLNTTGNSSPSVYSTGAITVTDSTGLATGSSMAVIEGKNSITLNNTKLIGYAIGRGTGGVDDTGVMVYQSMSGDADTGVGTFTANDSTLEISSDSDKYTTSPMFFVTNTNAVINLKNTELIFGSGILLSIAGNDGEWGTAGSNGGLVTFNAEAQTLTGNITVDEISTLALTLKSSTTLISTVNAENTAKEITITLDSTSKWEVTGDSYITALTDEDSTLSNIISNGYTIYYDSTNSANSWLNGETVTLSDGGTLTPMA